MTDTTLATCFTHSPDYVAECSRCRAALKQEQKLMDESMARATKALKKLEARRDSAR